MVGYPSLTSKISESIKNTGLLSGIPFFPRLAILTGFKRFKIPYEQPRTGENGRNRSK